MPSSVAAIDAAATAASPVGRRSSSRSRARCAGGHGLGWHVQLIIGFVRFLGDARFISQGDFDPLIADQKRFPDGPDADERDASLISSLFNQRHMYEAQLAAINYFERHPDGEFADYVTRETRIPPPPRRGKP
ncbi:MAG TPA: hypothetical protein VER04_15870 [Polyangiaceae bacterium]|nr:hypothetical protein [Polyangiaceae bacterium]